MRSAASAKGATAEAAVAASREHAIHSQHTRSNGSSMKTTKRFAIEFTALLLAANGCDKVALIRRPDSLPADPGTADQHDSLRISVCFTEIDCLLMTCFIVSF